MTKSKERSQRKGTDTARHGEQKARQVQSAPSTRATDRPTARPPRPNLPLLIVSAVVFLFWLAFLLTVTMVG